MTAFIYYISLPFIYLVSYSPSWILYGVSDFLFFVIYRIVGYRREVVFQNLSNSFPEKDAIQLKQIEKKYYRYLCDLLVESIKTITMSEGYVRKRLTFHSTEKVNALYEEGKSIVVVMGHFGNWELAGPCFSLNCKHQLNVVYKPLSNPYFERLFAGSRTKFGTKIIPVNNTLRAMAANRKSLTATALIADQTPSDTKNGFWLNFLHQDTLVYTGPEKIGKMFDSPIVYMHVDRVKRGYYEITPTILFAQPKKTEEEEITRAFFQKLENEIIKKPETWLWSHKRWKKKREVKA